MKLPNHDTPEDNMPPIGDNVGGVGPIGDDMPPIGGDMPPIGAPNNDMPPIDDGPDNGPKNEPNVDEKGEPSEIDSIFDKLGTEKQAAVIKYAKSMIDDTGDGAPKGDEMPMENAKRLSDMINEIINNVLSDEETNDDENRADKKIRNPKVTTENPFKSKR